MNVYEAVAARHTIRDFAVRPVERDAVKRWLDAGMKAPTNDHLRQWHFVLVDDPDRRRQLASFVGRRRTSEEIERLLDD